jgi:hypothetical protein
MIVSITLQAHLNASRRDDRADAERASAVKGGERIAGSPVVDQCQ